VSAAVARAVALVAPAENAFRSRWRFSTLRRLDDGLADALEEQMGLYEAALITGTEMDIKEQSEAMVRGWRAACSRMEAPLQDDDAYFEGVDYSTGLHVVIGQHIGSHARVQVKDGARCIFMTPDEVARMMAGVRLITDAKSIFPDAEIIEVTAAPGAAA
jgi:hypothetical protein